MDHRFIHWLGHASFRLEDGERTIYVDPWKLPPNSPPAHLILITHPHYDHLSAPDIARIAIPETIVVATPDASKQLTMKCLRAVAGQSLEAGSWQLTAVAAYNVASSYHPKSKGWVGYILRLGQGALIYHSGDTDLTPEVRGVKADVALLACGGTYTMNAAEAGEAAKAIGPKLVIPMHWGDIVGTKKDAEQVRSTFTGETVIKEPER
jgi:L-ascorbate metabolism protein UlaG (beta-lactamase superfamily)